MSWTMGIRVTTYQPHVNNFVDVGNVVGVSQDLWIFERVGDLPSSNNSGNTGSNNTGNTGGEGDGSQYLYQGADGTPTSTQDGTALSPFVGIVARATPGATWTDETVPNPYTFTQT